MIQVSEETFRELVREAIEDMPARFRHNLENVAFIVEQEPSVDQLRRQNLSEQETLLGLYEGVPHPERGRYQFVPPDRITIFQRPIERRVTSMADLEEQVYRTVYHEIAHHFGMNEARVRKAERMD